MSHYYFTHKLEERMDTIKQLQNKNIAILGYGLEGQSSYTFLIKQGISPNNISILDIREHLVVPEGVHVHLGETYLSTLHDYDIIFRAPGITDTRLREQGVQQPEHLPFTSQSQLFFDHYTGIIIGITGTKGKTTLATVSYLTLQKAGLDVALVGNIGTPVLDVIDLDNPPAYVVYELSSFMLESLDNIHIDIGVFNTLYPTHTAEHGNHEAYIAAKKKLIEASTYLLLGSQVTEVITDISYTSRAYNIYGNSGTYTFNTEDRYFYTHTTQLFSDQDMLLIGDHNRYNICAVIGIIEHLREQKKRPQEQIWKPLQDILASFQGVEYRLQNIGTYGGITWINDAIATTPQATMAAIESFGNKIDTLFYGGIVGNYDHSGVAKLIEQYDIHNIVLFPDSGDQLKSLLDTSRHAIIETRSMEKAVQFATHHTDTGSIALLSCGSPSFSCWSSYKEKGSLFTQYVHALKNA